MKKQGFDEIQQAYLRNEKWIGLAIGVFFSMLASVLVYIITATNIGISTDSVFYLTTAKRAMTEGFLAGVDSTGHFPPLYPWVLALAGGISGDLEVGARWINIFCAGITVFFLHRICWAEVKSKNRLFAQVIISFVLLSLILADDYLRLSAYVLSEPLFIALLIISIFFLQRGYVKPSLFNLCVGGFFLGGATLTRHTGLFFLATSVIWVIFTRLGKLPRWRMAVAYLFSSWSLIFLCKIVIRPTGSRALAFHWPGEEHWHDFGVTFASWFFPYRIALPSVGWVLAALIGTLCLARLFIWGRALIRGDSDHYLIINYLAAAVVAYLLLLFVTVVFIYYITPFDYRLLFPVHVLVLILLTVSVLRIGFANRTVQYLLLSGLFVWLSTQALKGFKTVRHYSVQGVGMGAKANLQSSAIQFLQSLPDDVFFVSNKPEVIIELLKKPCESIPPKFNSFTMAPEPSYSENMKALGSKFLTDKAVLVWFLETDRAFQPKVSEVLEVLPIERHETSDSKIMILLFKN